jgi:hypothetical protein
MPMHELAGADSPAGFVLSTQWVTGVPIIAAGVGANDQLLHTGASGGVALGGSRCVHQVIRAAGGDRLLLHGSRCVGLVHLQLSRSVNKWESLYE